MNPYNFALLLFAFCTFLIGLLILLKRRDFIARNYFIFSFFATCWGIGQAISIGQNVSYEMSLLATRLGQAAATFIPTRWLHFTLLIAHVDRRRRMWLIIPYAVCVFVDAFMFTPLFIPQVAPAVGFIYFLRAGLVFHIYTFMYFTFIPFGFYLLVSRIRVADREEKVQLKGFFFATLAGFLGGAFGFLPAYNVMMPQYGYFLMPFYPFVMGYFMIRHRLFDIEQVAQIFQREKLAAVGLLAASVNHEIRNPLYAAQTLLESYLENKKEGIPQKDPDVISGKALFQIRRALDVIGKLNRFSKPATDSITKASKASIQDAIQTVLDLVSYEFELDRIHITNQIDSNLPSIQADQRQLEEILFNLIVNACHAMSATQKADPSFGGKGGGTLTLNSKFETHKLILEISDTGTGIPSEQAKHLFEPFHTTKGEKGTGLGLYITKQLVERNGGKITVYTKEGDGTTFVLEFKALKEI